MPCSEDNFYAIEVIANEYKKVRLYLKSGKILIGESWGVNPAFDEEGEELPYNCLTFKPDDYSHPIDLLNEDILRAERL